MSVGCLSLPLSICDFQLSFPKLMFIYGAVSATSISWQYCRSDLLVLGQILSDSWIVTSCSRRVSSVQGCVSLWSELPKDFSGKISSLQLHLGKRQYQIHTEGTTGGVLGMQNLVWPITHNLSGLVEPARAHEVPAGIACGIPKARKPPRQRQGTCI